MDNKYVDIFLIIFCIIGFALGLFISNFGIFIYNVMLFLLIITIIVILVIKFS